MAVENLFHAVNARSALKLGHARGVAMLAAVEAGCAVVEYTPAEVKRAVVGYGRAEKHQVQQMIKLLLGLAKAPAPHDAADALAVAICHLHSRLALAGADRVRSPGRPTSSPHGVSRTRGPGASIVRPPTDDRISPRPHRRQATEQTDRRRPGRRLRGPRSAVDVLRRRRDTARSHAAHLHARPRGRAAALGFLTELERQLFERLIGISGIGPKLAIAVLSGMDPRDLVARSARRRRAADGDSRRRQEDVRAHRARAQGSARAAAGAVPGCEGVSTNGADRVRGDLLSALQNLGYHRPQAEKAIDATLQTMSDPTFEQALKAALRELMR